MDSSYSTQDDQMHVLADLFTELSSCDVINTNAAVTLAHALLRGAIINALSQISRGEIDAQQAQETAMLLRTMLELLRNEDGHENSWLNRLEAQM
ncbi:hypothetical protein FB107DRAFT_268407 [Schizophyllum commune]